MLFLLSEIWKIHSTVFFREFYSALPNVYSVNCSLRISWVPHLSLLKYQTPLSPFLLTFTSAVLLNSQPLTSISKISAIPLLHSTPFLRSPVNRHCKKKNLFLSLQCWKVSSSAHTSQRPSYLPGSVLSAHTMESEQPEQALYLHHKLPRVLCCCLALKPEFPAQGHSSCCCFRLYTHFRSYTQILPDFSHRVSRGFGGTQAPSPTKSPLAAPLLPAWSSWCTPGWQIPSAFPFLRAQRLWGAGSLRVCTCRCCVRADNIQPLRQKTREGLGFINNVPVQELAGVLSLVI